MPNTQSNNSLRELNLRLRGNGIRLSAVDVPGFLHTPVTEGNDVVLEALLVTITIQNYHLAQTVISLLHHLLSIEDNLSRDMKIITCTDSEDAPSDEMSGLDRNQVTEQILNFEVWSL
ncbi:unnamed protein product [Rhizophagus irregularis]|uniref:Uncharacterized protein n=1 Tax=Rhizophagus irregularis TaxID=588596 RepID=A0A916E4P4_9GLOM|nr:unnamed protein product [Rhizophagus irregularis]